MHENVDVVGLSGLITPSLDEMVHVQRNARAREVERWLAPNLDYEPEPVTV